MVPSLSSHRTELYDSKAFIAHAASLHQGFPHCAIFPTAASRRSLDRFSVPMWPVILLDRLPIAILVGRYPHQLINGRELILHRNSLTINHAKLMISYGINPGFPRLSLCVRQIAHALLTRPPLIQKFINPKISKRLSSFDLHVLSTPPAFVLSQDQTLDLKVCCSYEFWFLLRIF